MKRTKPQCGRCRVAMVRGLALQNALVGFPDFPGDTGREAGCTMSASGPTALVPCWKCPRCGASLDVEGGGE